METTDDGFELAAFDLSLRREGDILGNRQSGASVLKVVNVVRDGAIIEAAHADARAILEADPNLEAPEHRPLAREMRIAFSGESARDGRLTCASSRESSRGVGCRRRRGRTRAPPPTVCASRS